MTSSLRAGSWRGFRLRLGSGYSERRKIGLFHMQELNKRTYPKIQKKCKRQNTFGLGLRRYCAHIHVSVTSPTSFKPKISTTFGIQFNSCCFPVWRAAKSVHALKASVFQVLAGGDSGWAGLANSSNRHVHVTTCKSSNLGDLTFDARASMPRRVVAKGTWPPLYEEAPRTSTITSKCPRW